MNDNPDQKRFEGKRIAVLVPNSCNPDYRVIKQAEYLASQGATVRIFCTAKNGLPGWEELNGVQYRRISWNITRAVRKMLGMLPIDEYAELRLRRKSLRQRYAKFFDNRPEE